MSQRPCRGTGSRSGSSAASDTDGLSGFIDHTSQTEAGSWWDVVRKHTWLTYHQYSQEMFYPSQMTYLSSAIDPADHTETLCLSFPLCFPCSLFNHCVMCKINYPCGNKQNWTEVSFWLINPSCAGFFKTSYNYLLHQLSPAFTGCNVINCFINGY